MTAKIVPLKSRSQREPTLAELVARVHQLADEGRIGFKHPHLQERMQQRGILMRQILEVAKKGEGFSGPVKDKWGDWRIKMRRLVAGRRIQIVVAVKSDGFIVVTAI